jgi:hypothetical protein
VLVVPHYLTDIVRITALPRLIVCLPRHSGKGEPLIRLSIPTTTSAPDVNEGFVSLTPDAGRAISIVR